jgi:hypothetical protein
VQGNVAVLAFPTGLRGPSHFTLRLTDNGASPDKVEADTQWSDCSDLSLLDFEDTGYEASSP